MVLWDDPNPWFDAWSTQRVPSGLVPLQLPRRDLADLSAITADQAVDGDRNRTVATIELEREFAPMRTDARAMLRQKTLLGETYVELTPGRSKTTVPEGGRLGDGQVAETVQLDEIFDSLDPETRKAFRGWQQELAKGIEGRGRDFNDAPPQPEAEPFMHLDPEPAQTAVGDPRTAVVVSADIPEYTEIVTEILQRDDLGVVTVHTLGTQAADADVEHAGLLARRGSRRRP